MARGLDHEKRARSGPHHEPCEMCGRPACHSPQCRRAKARADRRIASEKHSQRNAGALDEIAATATIEDFAKICRLQRGSQCMRCGLTPQQRQGLGRGWHVAPCTCTRGHSVKECLQLELDSPDYEPPETRDLADRGFQRINRQSEE